MADASSNTKTGVLIVNVGSPDDPTPKAVRRFLREFLGDPGVIDINPVARFLLLNLVILPFRPRKSAEAYQAIWTAEGSPLILNSQSFRDALAAELGDAYVVALGMRYGNPSMASALDALMTADVSRILVMPLFPQHAEATHGSVSARAKELIATRSGAPPMEIVDEFYADPGYIEALAATVDRSRADFQPDFTLLSYHGLPERQVIASESGDAGCDRKGPCPAINPHNQRCYRAQCFATTRLLAEHLSLSEQEHAVAFQSRLGRTVWIGPYTDEILPRIYEAGHRRLLVVSPAFVADCLETLEELGLRLREQWLALGGQDFALAPCVNSDPAWITAAAALIRQM